MISLSPKFDTFKRCFSKNVIGLKKMRQVHRSLDSGGASNQERDFANLEPCCRNKCPTFQIFSLLQKEMYYIKKKSLQIMSKMWHIFKDVSGISHWTCCFLKIEQEGCKGGQHPHCEKLQRIGALVIRIFEET